LSAAEYSKETRAESAATSAKEKEQVTQYGAELRAVGLIPAGTDLQSSLGDLVDEGTLAYYDDQKKEIVVRGIEMSVGLRVTLAHELSHVLQDQYFGTDREFKTDTEQTMFRALLEGDADRIENKYVDSLSDAEQSAYQTQSDAQSSPSDL